MARSKSKNGSETAKNLPKKPRGKGVPFKANNPETGEKDPRINRAGRQLGAGFDELRKMALSIAQEKAVDRDGKPLLSPGKTEMTIGELILRMMAADPKRQEAFLEISHGKAEDIVHHLLSNIDLAILTEEQLARIAAGENIVRVLVTTQSAGGTGTPPAEQDR